MVNNPKPPHLSYGDDQSTKGVKIVSSERHMQMYDLNETEINAISTWNTLSTVAFSVASFFASQAVAIITQIPTMSVENLPTLGRVLVYYVLPSFLFLAVIFTLTGLGLLRGKKSILDSIKRETKIPDQKKQKPKNKT